MTEELRGLLRDELAAQRPPPLGDLVAVALRDGRRIRRRRRLAAFGGGTAVAGVLAATMALGGPFGPATRSGPAGAGDDRIVATARPTASRDGPAVDRIEATVRPTVPRPGGAAHLPPPGPPAGLPPRLPNPEPEQVRATPEAMLALLEELLPAGRTSAPAKTGPRDLHVQLYLDRGKGPGMIRVSVSGDPRSGPRTGTPAVTVDSPPDNCTQSTVARARWPDGLTVQADLATCLAWDGRRNPPAPQALSKDEASAIVADPRWGTTMDARLVRAGAERFPRVAIFG